jgi:hypothetical protein
MCSSPRLIAAYHALHRLSMPRHPPCALLRLISNSHVVSSPAIGPAQPVLIPHTLPAHTRALASEHPCANRQTIHSSIVKEQGGSRRAGREPGPAKMK